MKKNMKKNIVKLNENTLRKIVAESVKSILSEIDWKTYRNAQEKNREREPEYEKRYWELDDAIRAARKRGDEKEVQKLERKQEALAGKSLRTLNFGSASNSAFNDKFFANSHDRFNKQNGKSFAPFKNTDDGSYSTPEPWIDDSGNIHNGHYFDGHGKIGGKYFDDTIEYSKLGNGYGNVTYDGEMNGDDNTTYSDKELNSLGIPDNEFNDIEKARREIRRYRNGDYTYDNEKGWHLKESSENGNKKLLTEKGIKYNWRKPGEGQYGGTLWGNEENLEKYYAVYGASVYNEFNEEGDGAINPNRAKGYERFNSYTNTYVKILSLFPKYGKEKYNCVVKAIVGFPKTNNGFNSVYADNKKRAANAIVKALEDCGLTSLGTGYGPIKLTPVDPDENMAGGKIISKEIRPRGKEW